MKKGNKSKSNNYPEIYFHCITFPSSFVTIIRNNKNIKLQNSFEQKDEDEIKY